MLLLGGGTGSSYRPVPSDIPLCLPNALKRRVNALAPEKVDLFGGARDEADCMFKKTGWW
jgi:hypothetical protein